MGINMRNIGTLKDLQQGCHGVVLGIDSEGNMRQRLQHLGLIEGTEVRCIRKSPLGDPAAYCIRGAIIALRSEDSSCVRVQWV